MKILNAYCGVGGNRKLWGDNHEITAVEINPEIASEYKKLYKNDRVIVGDAHQYILEHLKEFNIIWSSPPCPRHSRLAKPNYGKYNNLNYPDMKLWQEIILLQHFFKGKYVVENVIPYYDVFLHNYKKLERHLFWSNFNIPVIELKLEKRKSISNMTIEELEKYHKIKLSKKIYCEKNHDYRQILRNCVHPEIGKYILDIATESYVQKNINQQKLF